MIRSLAVTILVSCALLSRGAAQEITLDSARHTVVMRAGPFMAEPAEHSEHYGHAGMMDSDDPVRRFMWPCDAWLRGFALRLEDAEGRELPLHWIRSEEHTSELQSPCNLVCRLLLEKKKTISILAASIAVHCTRR